MGNIYIYKYIYIYIHIYILIDININLAIEFILIAEIPSILPLLFLGLTHLMFGPGPDQLMGQGMSPGPPQE